MKGNERTKEEFYDCFNYCKIYMIKSITPNNDIKNEYNDITVSRMYRRKDVEFGYIVQSTEKKLGLKKDFPIKVGDFIYFDSNDEVGVMIHQ